MIKVPHVWRDPPPGGGDERICQQCGERESVLKLEPQRANCVPTLRQPKRVSSEYDPLAAA